MTVAGPRSIVISIAVPHRARVGHKMARRVNLALFPNAHVCEIFMFERGFQANDFLLKLGNSRGQLVGMASHRRDDLIGEFLSVEHFFLSL
jgi:hypothetical protein